MATVQESIEIDVPRVDGVQPVDSVRRVPRRAREPARLRQWARRVRSDLERFKALSRAVSAKRVRGAARSGRATSSTSRFASCWRRLSCCGPSISTHSPPFRK
jgi:hypothetical protein